MNIRQHLTIALAPVLLTGVLAGACAGVKSKVRTGASVLSGAAQVLTALSATDGPEGFLDLALGYLEDGDVPACCAALKAYLVQGGKDPRVRGLLALLEAEVQKAL